MENTITDKYLFDKNSFIKKLKQENTPLPLFKKALTQGYDYLSEQFKSGEDIELIVKNQGCLIDQLLTFAWDLFIDSDQLCLVAVGGYGRNELMLASDIDLMVLQKPRLKKDIEQQIQSFLIFLWDFGLEVGHSVRTVKECKLEAKNDITVITNIMESRLICGNEKLHSEMHKVTSPKKIWPAKKFFEEKLLEQKNRHKKYSDSTNKLEPNIKESPGGLRDIQMIGWVAERQFDSIDIKNLVKQKFLTRDEYETLKTSRNFLWRIRFALHMTTGRREDRLLFENQKKIAGLLGFKGKENKDIEAFMKLYFKTIREINRLNEILLQHFEEEIIYKKRKEKIVVINSRFQKRNDFIEVANKNTFKKYPFALFEIFLLIQQDPKIKGVRASTIRLIRSHLYLIDSTFRKDIRNRSLFLEIIRQPNLVGHKLRMMHRYGILGAYLPAFAKIEGLMQFDLFHIFTVDEHILAVIQNMRLFGTDEYKDKFPICNDLIKKLPKLELLYLAGLFHDIAKGRDGDHSTLGIKDAENFCKLHGLSDYDTELVAWLVENHLVMSKTAQRKDIDDPDIIMEFANHVQTQMRLNYLHVLTVADICGTNPELWNSWRGMLLTNLYHRTLRVLRHDQNQPIARQDWVESIKKETLALIDLEKHTKKEILNLWKDIEDDYFLRHAAELIAWQTEGILKHKNKIDPLVLVNKKSNRGNSLVFVYMKDRKNIFSTICRVLEKLGLNVLDARIITNKNSFVLDTFVVFENDGSLIKSEERSKEIRTKILNGLNLNEAFPEQGKWIENRQLKNFNFPSRITFETDEKNNRSIMEVNTVDRPGVLSRISIAMDLCGAKLQGAKIATYGERVEDIFYLQNDDNKAIDDPLKFECLKKSILEALS
ncbi:MAG: [protein-PII] uridylyltransferase [Proteobacteria bacterium]|nr:[protein-PII] uridylyltransferase [Pseudomonadota bacterium]NOG60811.1 [protein-PII] uridylyltransferase [Pseudomonadota bacterium]